jgi:3-keto-5-aminohexanoate cleavage enzyme
VFLNPRPELVAVAARLRARRLVPECEAYDAGMLETLRWLVAKGHLAPPFHVQLVLGVPGGMAATERNLRFLVEDLPAGVAWSAAGVGRAQLPTAELALALGGHVRVGLEDNLYVSKGVLARGSDELVALAVNMAARHGRDPATPEQARALLGIEAARAVATR